MMTATEKNLVRQKITHSFLLLISMLSGLFYCNVDTFAAIKILPIRWGYFRCEAGTFTLKKTGIPCRAVACEKGRSSTELNAYLREGQICCSLDILEADPFLSPVLAVLYTIFAMTNSTLINFPAYVDTKHFNHFFDRLLMRISPSVCPSVYLCVRIHYSLFIMMIIIKKSAGQKMSRVERLSARLNGWAWGQSEQCRASECPSIYDLVLGCSEP